MTSDVLKTRRSFLAEAGTLGAGLIVSASPFIARADAKQEPPEIEISPGEDLMREHGVLRRVILIYEEVLARMEDRREIPVDVLAGSAGIIRRFIENYHEKLEEDEVFPRFEKAGKQVDLVKVLTDQHREGRRLTDIVLRTANPATLAKEDTRGELAKSIRLFIRMYRPHAAREDTVLFPAVHSVVPNGDYDKLGDAFEEKEAKLLGTGGFETTVEEVAAMEKTLGIFDLKQFTPTS